MKTRMSTNKKLGQKIEAWLVLYLPLQSSCTSSGHHIAQVSSVRETGLLPLAHTSYGALAKLPQEPTGPCSAEQALTKSWWQSTYTTQKAGVCHSSSFRETDNPSQQQRCLGTTAPTPHAQPHEAHSAPWPQSVMGWMNSDGLWPRWPALSPWSNCRECREQKGMRSA